MNSKILKISFLLLFILIAMGFFNSVFALGEVSLGRISVPISSSTTRSFELRDLYTDEVNMTYDGYRDLNNLRFSNNAQNLDVFNNILADYNAGKNICYMWIGSICYIIPYVDGTEYFYAGTGNNNFGALYSSTGNLVEVAKTSGNYQNGEYFSISVNPSNPNTNYVFTNSYYVLNNISNFVVKDYEGNVVYSNIPDNTPTNEELTADCNLNVNFKFQPKSTDFPNDNVTSHPLYSYKCLITHEMLNWENYNIKFSLEKNIQGESWNSTYYDFYDINGNKLVNKQEILYNSYTLQNLSEDDFIYVFADNKFDVMKLKYYIYNTNNELLFTKTYTFKFTEDGLTVSSATGTVLTENTQNSNGEDISNTNTSFDTNGYNNTNAINTDYYDVGSINSLTNNASDTIILAKECFSILPGFVWGMVGIFLSVCIALRILGR